jgi:hypothetical protein
MAFITTSDISSNLPVGFDTGVVDRLLVVIEAELRSKDVVFDPIIPSIRQLEPDYSAGQLRQSLFDVNFLSSVSSVKIKRRGDTSETALTLDDDYVLAEHQNLDTIFTRIEIVKREISTPHYLEINGKFGLFVDFSDTNSFLAKLIKAGIIEFIRNQLSLKKNAGQGAIASASEAGSSISYHASSIDMSRTIWDSPDFMSVIKYIF